MSRRAACLAAVGILALKLASDGLIVPCWAGTQTETQRDYPIVIRITETAFQSSDDEIEQRAPVDTCVLGMRNVGNALISASLIPDFVVSEGSARVELIVRGTCQSRTVGRRAPATIVSTTNSRVEIRKQLLFDEAIGFTAAPANASVEITSTRRSVRTSSPGLRGRLVRRVARRRIRESASRVERIVERQTQQKLESGMDAAVSKRLDGWNQQWSELRTALQQQSWYGDDPKLHFATDQRSLFILVASENAAEQSLALNSMQLAPASPDALIEVHVQIDALSTADQAVNQGDLIAQWLAALHQPLLVLVGQDPVAITTSEHGRWTIFHVMRRDEESGVEQR